MSFRALDISLEEFEIGLSGAVPEREGWSEPAMDRGILEFVQSFSGIVFKYGGRIVHGCHPTFTPVILRQARLHAGARLRKPVTLVMSALWANDLSRGEVESMIDIAELVITKKEGGGGPENTDTRNRSLTAMRRVLVDAQIVMVAVGGKMHTADGKVPGVAEEMKFAELKGIPRFLIGGLGGFSQVLAKGLTPYFLNNSLTHEENVALFSTTDVSACVNILVQHLARSESLAKTLNQPIKWNPGNRAILDHRDGTLSETTNLIDTVLAV